jgi:hypothetical protein
VLYLPRGWLHSAAAEDDVSAHLTVGVHVVTRYALVEALAALVADDADLRAALPLGLDVADPEALAPHVDTVRAALHAALDRVPVEAVARKVRGKVWQGGRPEPLRPVASPPSPRASHPATPCVSGSVCTAGSPAVMRSCWSCPTAASPSPTPVAPALEALLGGGTHVVGDLPGLPAADQVVLVRRLLREGVLVPAARP